MLPEHEEPMDTLRLTIDTTCDGVFAQQVKTALSKTEPLRCADQNCPACNGQSQQHELAHYARQPFLDWKDAWMNNQLCWTENIADRSKLISRITDQPGRRYAQLCLIRFRSCPGLEVIRDDSSRFAHYRILFGVPEAHIAKLTFEYSDADSDSDFRYVIAESH